ncbi:MAG: S41 family peptidase [Bacteroidales bacterium]|nr:S41 family peptidase [Bacteroidales bacterium]MDD4001701.1 S41 family peptidase [Bacteroidales bacterium]
MKQIIFSLFLLISSFLTAQNVDRTELLSTDNKMSFTLNMIRYYYAQKPDMPTIVEKGIVNMLKELDPHSIYISKEDVQKMNEPLVGNFDGVGISFQIMKDTIHVVDVIRGGPSEKVGVVAGDKILKVDDKFATGDTIKNDWVFKHLRGVKGTKVILTVERNGRKEPIVFEIIRDKIPITSVDTWFMLDKTLGYIRLDRFAQNSTQEVLDAVRDLKKQGMKELIFDLRGNGGGYLDVAFKLSDEFLSDDKLIVYTEGVSSPRYDFKAETKGEFEKGKLVILIDESSASASEIVSGAVQDWDRGVIVGRRSFGKGLVQRPFNLPDGSQIRLTTSRYFTPSGRCIQKPWDDGLDSYYNDYMKRYQHKELITPDSIKFPDSLKYTTFNKRIVYGGGGIMPDVFVPIDTSRASDYLINLRSKGIFNNFSMQWVDRNRESFLKQNPTFEDFNKTYASLNLMEEFSAFAKKEGVEQNQIKKEWVNSMVLDYIVKQTKDTAAQNYTSYQSYANELLTNAELLNQVIEKAKQEDEKMEEMMKKSDIYIEATLKAMIARNLYGINYYYQSIKDTDEGLQKAIQIIKDDKVYNSIISK